MSKKILAILLSLSMIGVAVGIPVFADEVEAETAEVMEIAEADETEKVAIVDAETNDENADFKDVWNVSLMASEETSIEQPTRHIHLKILI